MLYGDIGLPMRRLDFGCSYCQLSLLAGAGGAVRGAEVEEWGIRLAVCRAYILWGKGVGEIFRACMLSLGNVVYYHSLLMQMASSVAVRGGEVEEWGIGLAVCAWILWGKGVGGVRRGHVCCLWGMLSVTAPCWSWWGALWRRGRGGECGIGLAVCACIPWGKGAGEIFRACILSLGNVVYYRSLLVLVASSVVVR